jgi:mRNA interferase MazF
VISRIWYHFAPTAANALAITQADLTSGSLPVASWIRTNRIVTLNVSLVVATLGHVSDRIVDTAVERFCGCLGFFR